MEKENKIHIYIKKCIHTYNNIIQTNMTKNIDNIWSIHQHKNIQQNSNESIDISISPNLKYDIKTDI